VIALLGTTADDLSISEHAATINGFSTEQMITSGAVPKLDLKLECAVQKVCLEAAETGWLASAHDCSDGGLAVALAECCFSSLNRGAIGAEISLTDTLAPSSVLFSESPSRIVVSFAASVTRDVEKLAAQENCPFAIIGRVGGERLRIELSETEIVSVGVKELENVWRTSLATKLEAEVMAAGKE